jgi:hypothetical protein
MWAFVFQAHLAWRQQSLNFMAISSLTAAALISGSKQQKGKTMKIKVTRKFYIAGELQKEGSVIEVSDAVGHELIGMNKAEKAKEKPAKEAKE